MNWDDFVQSLNAKTDDAPIIVNNADTKASRITSQSESDFDEDTVAALTLLIGLPLIAKNNE